MTVVLAKALLYTHFNKKAEEIALEDYKPGDKLIPFKVVGEYKGTDLVGMEYEQLIPWVKPVEATSDGWVEASAKAFRVIPGDYVNISLLHSVLMTPMWLALQESLHCS